MNVFQYQCIKPIISWRNSYLKHQALQESRRLKLYDKAVQEVSQFTGDDPELIKRRQKEGPHSEADFQMFETNEQLPKEEVERFYTKAKFYLYELPLWNAERSRPRYLYRIIKPYLKKYQCRKVLDFGGGTGDLCLEFGRQGLDVSYCDIGEEVAAFAKWRFQNADLKIPMHRGLSAVEGQEFDAVISFDCLEHVSDLPSCVRKLTDVIKVGGLLILAEAFEGGGLHLKENAKYHDFKTFDRFLESYQLKFVGRFAQYFFYQKK